MWIEFFYGVLGINVKRDQLVGNNLGLNTQIHSFKEKLRPWTEPQHFLEMWNLRGDGKDNMHDRESVG